ncbi:MAG: YjbQ family protein [Deltaproteobacteria bacterium]|nr:YjbQ family protein [Deltaproteobacteria bacterium]MBN2671722.1 YjbQ family protein [Deltaproteobacteria bacterium]
MVRKTLHLQTTKAQQMVDVTRALKEIAAEHPDALLMSLYARGATAAIMVQENWDPNITTDILTCLSQMAPAGQWLHDQVDGNADAHIKAGIVGPSEVIPLEDGQMLLSTWQNVFFCDFDGPRSKRELVVTLLP